MIQSVQFKNFRVLRDTTLPLNRVTLLVGPNGSGKSTALLGLQAVGNPGLLAQRQVISAAQSINGAGAAEVIIEWGWPHAGVLTKTRWTPANFSGPTHQFVAKPASPDEQREIAQELQRIRIYSFDAKAIMAPVPLGPALELQSDGGLLAGVLDQLRDQEPERFEALNAALGQWLPEFDRILFDSPASGQRAFLLRLRAGQHKIPAADLSQGVLLALAMLTLAYLPDSPSLVCLEEPDRGIHPRLLRNVQDALYRLSYPENFGEQRKPVQVIVTTHSPYLLDLYRDHPEEIVIANKTETGVSFERLSDQPEIEEILRDAQLGDVWYTGILGGVPVPVHA